MVLWLFAAGFSVDPTGWWISEKLDGVRAFWDGKAFYSRLGNEFIPPSWFVKVIESFIGFNAIANKC